MDLSDYLAILRQHIRLIIVAALIGVLVAAVVTLLQPREYEADAQMFVSTQGQDSTSLLQGSSFSQQRVKSYAQVITSPLILDPVIASLELDTSAPALAEQMTAIVPLDTVLINLTVTGENPVEAAAIADAVSTRFSETLPMLENAQAKDSPVQVTVVKKAIPPVEPTSPNVPLNLAAGTLGGLLLGAGLTLVREITDSTVRGESDVRTLTDNVIIGGIPFGKEEDESSPVQIAAPLSPRAEAFRSLRTNLQFVDAAHSAKTLVITSSVPGEGKTTTVVNLALALGESGAKVCVVEADLRRPRVTHYMGLADGAGLTNLILGNADYSDVIQPYSGHNVVVIGAGPIPPNPSELLGSEAMGEIIEDLAENFDYVLFDAPPLLPVTDAAVLTKQVNGAVVVVGTGIVRKEQLRKTLELLGTVGSDLLGLVLTRLPGKGPDAYMYYREGYESDPVHDPNAPRTSARSRRLRRGA